jgi:hypothetical protein
MVTLGGGLGRTSGVTGFLLLGTHLGNPFISARLLFIATAATPYTAKSAEYKGF